MTTWSELTIGFAAPPRTDKPLTVTDFVRYQGASGDMNPLHHDPAAAKAAGYDTVFAVGMLAAGRLGTFVTDWLGPRNIRKLGVRFKEQAWAGDELTYTAVVAGRREENGERLVDLELSCVRQTGGKHLEGWATFACPEP
jgi:acyl dehydratase